MAKKKKKKVNPKQQQAEHRKAYLRKTNELAAQLGVDNFIASLSSDQLYHLYELRIRGINMRSESPAITPKVMSEIKRLQAEAFREYQVTLTKDGPRVLTYEFLTSVITLYYFLDMEGGLKNDDELRGQFAAFAEWVASEDGPFQQLNDLLWFITLDWCELTHRLYWISHNFEMSGYHVSNNLQLNTVQPEQRHVRLDGRTRTVYRVGWAVPSAGPQWVRVSASLFDDPAARGRDQLPVFVQSHALHRLEERLDCTPRNQQQLHLYVSLQEPKVVKGPTGKWLIRFYFSNFHLGYLVTDIVDGILLIRTFLFITMDSTPEGYALQQALGLAAVDKKYLSIDRLSTFFISDIREHPDLKEHFVQAGCNDLFRFNTEQVLPEHRIQLGDRLRSYLDTGGQRELHDLATHDELLQEMQEAGV
jgi:hypothetical protein